MTLSDLFLGLGRKKKKSEAPLFSLPLAPEWTTGDILNLRRFLASDTGQKMMQRARTMGYSIAVSGAQDQFHTAHSAGQTVGFHDALKWIESCASDEMFSKLSQATGEQVANQNTADGEGVSVSAEILTP